MIDRRALLAELQPAAAALEDDIRGRLSEVEALDARLRERFENAKEAGRTAMAFEQWSEGEITQAAVAWVLACVFVRFLEDNELIDRPLLSGPGDRRAAAAGQREEYFHANPADSDREYFEHALRTVARYPAVAALYDERHNPLWQLGPTGDGATALLALWQRIDPDTGALLHDFSSEGLDTRFLGDLYQDLSEAAKQRYALLQTPEFVEEFILDRTLDPALEEFGLDAVRMIDPTCGSGHFLIGGFRRLFARWREREPGSSAGVLAQRALDGIYGVDLNPYATAIARFRLVIAALRACGVRRLGDAPALRLNLATGDSLLHGPERGQFPGFERRAGIEHVYDTEDAPELARIFGQGYHAVVGNPPYKPVSDSALRDAYRARYDSCHGKYSLSVPFMERFFELATPELPGERGVAAGYVGKITANSFMKREFGGPLIERFLPSVDVTTLIDTSGAYIPGHGTPTVILFGRQRKPTATTVHVLDGIRGEPSQPDDPARGLVWTSILERIDEPGAQDRFIRASDVARAEFAQHPMTLGIGRDLRKTLERLASNSVSDVTEAAGITGVTGEDELYTTPHQRDLNRLKVTRTQSLVVGDGVRDWFATSIAALWTFDDQLEVAEPDPRSGDFRLLWLGRAAIARRKRFGTPMVERGLTWFEWQELYPEKLRTPFTITWGEVATHNHFVLDRGGKVFKQTAPVIKLPAGATEDEHLGLLGVLNSATACFWLKQVCQPKGAHLAQTRTREERYAFNASNVEELPIPVNRPPDLARAVDTAATERCSLPSLDSLSPEQRAPLRTLLARQAVRDTELLGRMISLQEELDWQVMANFGLVDGGLATPGAGAPALALGERAFEIVLARQLERGEVETTWFVRHGSTPITRPPEHWPDDYRAVVEQRIALIESDPDVGLIERPEHKRRWAGKTWEARQGELLESFVLDSLEELPLWREHRLRSTAELTDAIRADTRLVEACELLADSPDVDLLTTATQLVVGAAVPFLAAWRYKPSGLRKRAIWERVWELQRIEDRTGTRQDIPVPPRYSSSDFRSQAAWKLRGKLDVPKERFVLYPGAERGADASPVVGWAGWSHREQALALAARILDLREREDPDAERLTPLLAGLLELLPWIHQWHPDADPDYGGPPGDYFESWLDQQLSELALTRESLRAWHPQAPTRGRRPSAAG